MEPGVHRGPGAVGHYIQQPATLQVDQAGDPPGGRQAGCPKEARLVQPERGHTVQACGVVHQQGAVLVDGPHDGHPADPEVTGDRRHRVGVLADPPAGLGPGPLGQHRPRVNRPRLLGPGPHSTGRLPTAPQALAPQQHHRAPTDRQVPHPDRAAAVELGPHPAALTADHGSRGLDLELPLAADHLRGDDLKAVQAQQPGGCGTTVLTHLGPPCCRRHASASYARSQVLFWRLLRHPQQGTTPRFMTKSRITRLAV
jgi:hypothetical protein